MFTLTSAALTFGIVFNRTLPGIIVTFFLNGICSGCMDAGEFDDIFHPDIEIGVFLGSCIFVIDIWGKENQPFLHFLHFAFGLGAFIAPLIATPFLLPRIDIGDVSNLTLNGVNITLNQTRYLPDDVRLMYPYGLIAIFLLINAVIFLTLFLTYRETPPHPSRILTADTNPDVDSKREAESISASDTKSNTQLLLIIIMTAFMLFYVGLEITFGSFLTTYSVNSAMKLSKATGALITSCFWATFTFFRLFAAVYIGYTGAELNLIFEIILILISNVFLMGWGNSVEWALWTGTALLGLGTSSVYASVFGYIEEYFPVTSTITSIFCISACVGEFIIPTVISSFVKIFPEIFLYVTLVCSLMITMLFAISCILFRTLFTKIDHK